MIDNEYVETLESEKHIKDLVKSTFIKKKSLKKKALIMLIISFFLILLITFIMFLIFNIIKIKTQFYKYYEKLKIKPKRGLIRYRNNSKYRNHKNYINSYSISGINMTEIYLYKDNPDEKMWFYQFLCPKKVVNRKRVLIGIKKDGSYVMLDDFENIKIAYSFGIDGEITFDKALTDKGIDVYMYDHTINNLTYGNAKFHWKKIGIGGNSERRYNIQTLQEMMKKNGHLNEKNMILKMDVEGAEWNSFDDLTEDILMQFKYILVEYHLSKTSFEKIYNVLRKLYKSHQVFYIHCNPWGVVKTFGNNTICDVIEVSYINRNGYSFAEDESNYPIPELSYDDKKDFDVNILKLFHNYKPS